MRGMLLMALLQSLTVSGNEITDATRATATQGDGLSSDGSFGIWEGTTNLVTNGGFETNNTGHVASSGNTIARSTDQAKFGSASGKATYGGTGGATGLDVWNTITLTAVKHTVSVWVYVPTDWDGVQIKLNPGAAFTGATVETAVVDLDIRDAWQRVVGYVTPVAGDLTGQLRLDWETTAPTSGRFIYTDGWQCEAQPIATPYVETNGGTASRSAARVQVPETGIFNETQGWAAFRVRPGFDFDNVGYEFHRLFDANTDGEHGLHLHYFSSDSPDPTWALKNENGSDGMGGSLFDQVESAAQTFVAGDELTVISYWTSSTLGISVNGSTFSTVSRDEGVPDLSALTTIDIGKEHWQNNSYLDGDILWAAFGTGTLSDADAARIHNAAASEASYTMFRPANAIKAFWSGEVATILTEFPVCVGVQSKIPLMGGG